MSDLITTGRLDATEFGPLSPEEGGWVPIEGDPNVRVHTLCENGEIWAGVALVEPSTFEYPSEYAGCIQLLEGEATMSVGDRTVELGPGSVVFLTKGATSTWRIRSPLREFFVAFTPAEDAH